MQFDSGKIMAKLEAEDSTRFRLDDSVLAFKVKRNGIGEAVVPIPKVPGVQHVSVLIEGAYQPEVGSAADGHGERQKMPRPERFERVLTTAIATVGG